MLVFPNCKINLGLYVVNKRPDGFHNIETVFYPVSWCDALEVIQPNGTAEAISFSQSGLPVNGDMKDNLIYKAWELIAEQRQLPPIQVHLHKNLPMGAGLGGGSADAAFFINQLNTLLTLGFSEQERMSLASQLGSDCAFFIRNTPVFATEKGNVFTELKISLASYYILVVHPGVHSNTREAYEGLTPAAPAHHLPDVLREAPETWKHKLVNDFEPSIFRKYPAVKKLKEELYDLGAIYASMSGSGSAVFGIFKQEPAYKAQAGFQFYLQKPAANIL